jgi:hypothetical protein
MLTNTSIYTIGPLEEALLSPTGYPIIDLFYSSTKSLASINTMTAIIIINFASAAISTLGACSRQLWSFARNRGLPFSSVFAPVCLLSSSILLANL